MNQKVKYLSLSSLFLALGLILPFLTGQIPQIGSMLLPMHIPVILCGLICGWKYGLVTGFLTPFIRSLVFMMPPMFPTAIAMSFELGCYGLVCGFMYNSYKHQCIWHLYKTLIAAMISGRLVFGLVMWVLMSASGNVYTFSMFISSALLGGIPGIIVQLILIPCIMLALHKTGMVPFKGRKAAA